MKSFFYGVAVEGIIGIVSLVMKDSGFFMKASGVVGFGSLFISGIVSGFMSENIYRRTAVENAGERRARLDRSGSIFIFSIPGIISFLASVYLRG
ncbi:MAG: hypothetical protein PWQ97_1522 [Tepidanaerobacteraceae bacterium]|nr:hypothetical protein [Tepidanaerobacteraceae bacterium]